MTKKKTNRVDEGFLDALIGDTGAAGLRSMFKKGMNRQAQLAQDRFLKDFIGDAVASLNAGIKGKFVDPSIRGGTTAATNNVEPEDSMAVKTAKSRTATQPAGSPGATPPTGGTAPKPPAPGTPPAPTAPKPAGTSPAPAPARPVPKVAPKTYPAPANTRDVKAASRVPDDISESAYYKKLNALFESIFEATGGQSIAAYMTGWFNKYMGGVDWATHKSSIEPLIQQVEDTYDKDKGYKAIQQLANAAFALAKTSNVTPAGAKDIEEPKQPGTSGTNNTTQTNAAQANALTLDQITKVLPNMQLRELEYIRDTIDSVISSKKKPATDQTQYTGNVAPSARAATKPASPLTAPTVPNRGTISTTGTAPRGDITKGGLGITRESRRSRR